VGRPQPKSPRRSPQRKSRSSQPREIAAASSNDVLGKPSPGKPNLHDSDAEEVDVKPLAEERLPVITDASGGGARPKTPPRKKPITVAATPIIGNYQLPPFASLNFPDATVKPTESKEDLMANARLMQSTLAQFDIDVALGDITKGPTITRYELHPAPGVRWSGSPP